MAQPDSDTQAPLVSIGIPTYNRPDLLQKAIERARSQTYPHLEIIISDNASTDPRVDTVCRQAAKPPSRQAAKPPSRQA